MESIDENFNPLFIFMIIICLCGCAFLLFLIKDISAGAIYTFIMLISISFIVLLNTWLKDDQRWKPLTDYMRIPIGTSLKASSIMYLVGLGIPLVLKIVLSIFTSFQVTSFSIPLLASDISTGFQSFSASQVSGSIGWQEFITVYVAGTVETFAFNFMFPFIMIFAGLFLFKMFTDDDSILGIDKKYFVLFFSILMTGLVFMTLHSLNETYTTTTQFLFALGFIVLANISIYFFGLALLFWVGFHQMNNLIYLVESLGLGTVLSGGLLLLSCHQ